MSDDVISIGVRKKYVDSDRTLETVRIGDCHHPRFIVDDRLCEVQCAVCKERVSPMWVLGQIAHQETAIAERRNILIALVKKLNDKVRFKCRSCGKMNDMSRIVKVSPREFWESERDRKKQ